MLYYVILYYYIILLYYIIILYYIIYIILCYIRFKRDARCALMLNRFLLNN